MLCRGGEMIPTGMIVGLVGNRIWPPCVWLGQDEGNVLRRRRVEMVGIVREEADGGAP